MLHIIPIENFKELPLSSSAKQVIMAEAPDALDPISALREHHRTAQRAQAVNQARANEGNQRRTEVDYELFKSKFWPKISPHAAGMSELTIGIR